MLCQICKQAEATVFFIEINEEDEHGIQLCEQCAQQKHLQEVLQRSAKIIQKLWASLAQVHSGEDLKAASSPCPECGLTLARFKKTGRLGCGTCYDHFERFLSPWLRHFHHLDNHDKTRTTGHDQPLQPSAIDKLKAALNDAIEQERYEEAAAMRDQLRALEKQGS